MSAIVPLFVAAVVLHFAASQISPAPSVGSFTLQDVLAHSHSEPLGYDDNSTNFDILNNLLALTGQLNALKGAYPRGLTLFAPHDAAFVSTVSDITKRIPETEGEAFNILVMLLSRQFENPLSSLIHILAYHMVDMAIDARTLSTVAVLTASNGEHIYFNAATGALHDQEPALPDAMLVPSRTDIWASNGVIHVIDRVLIPYDFLPDPATTGSVPSDEMISTPSPEMVASTPEYSGPNEAPSSTPFQQDVGETYPAQSIDVQADVQQSMDPYSPPLDGSLSPVASIAPSIEVEYPSMSAYPYPSHSLDMPMSPTSSFSMKVPYPSKSMYPYPSNSMTVPTAPTQSVTKTPYVSYSQYGSMSAMYTLQV